MGWPSSANRPRCRIKFHVVLDTLAETVSRINGDPSSIDAAANQIVAALSGEIRTPR